MNDFDYVIKHINNIDSESIKTKVLCELAKGIAKSESLTDGEKKDRLLSLVKYIDDINDPNYKDIVLGQIALNCANLHGANCNQELYSEIIDEFSAQNVMVNRLNNIKSKILNGKLLK